MYHGSKLSRCTIGKLFYRLCDNHKNEALKFAKGNYMTKTTLPEGCRQDLKWWEDNIQVAHAIITLPPPSITLESDASNNSWGAAL